MVKLTEEMIVARTRVSDMANVKKLNCWGAELTDISVLRKLVNVEVLSLSVNCITSLADIQNCHNLQELYIRKNKIPDLSEICWLKDLSKLKSIWLEENPCVDSHGELYRVTVIRTLPQLQKLDNLPVQSDEMADAMRRGIELVHPLEREPGPQPMSPPTNSYQSTYRPPQQAQQEESSAAPSSSQDHQSREESPYEANNGRRMSQASIEQNYPPSRRVSNQAFDSLVEGGSVINGHKSSPARQISYAGSVPLRSNSTTQAYTYAGNAPASDEVNTGSTYGGPEYHVGRRYSQQELRRSPRVSQSSFDGSESTLRRMSIHEGPYEDERASVYQDPPAPPPQRGPPVHRNSYVSSYGGPGPDYSGGGGYYDFPHRGMPHDSHQPSRKQGSIPEQEETPPESNGNSTNNHTNGDLNKSLDDKDDEDEIDGDDTNHGCNGNDEHVKDRAMLAQQYEHTYDMVNQQIEMAQQHMARRKSYTPDRSMSRRPKNRNSNILSAVLCLIKELDGPSLEVAEMAIKCRMDELDD